MAIILWSAFLIWASTASGLPLPDLSVRQITLDKAAHAGAYFILALLIMGAAKRLTENKKTAAIAGAAISSAYGLAMELLQFSFFPNRNFEVYDIIANIIGSLFAILAFIFYTK